MLYEFIDKWDGNRLFTYIVIFIAIIWIFTQKELGINILIALLVGFFVINYLNYRTTTNAETIDNIQNIKKDIIRPKLYEQTKKQNDIVDFLFSIQDLYMYLPQQYEVMVNSINYFYDLYNDIIIDHKTCYANYDTMKRFKRDALNALMSLIYTIPEDIRVRKKINESVLVLDKIMTKDLDQISYIIDDYTYKNGYSVDTKIIDYGCKAVNEYEDIFQIFSSDIF